jgi:hypothetical protein
VRYPVESDLERVQTGGGQLDGQRQAVEAADDVDDRRQLARRGLEAWRHGAGAVDEQLDGRTAVGGRRQGRNPVHLLAGDAQPFLARRHDADVRAAGEHVVDQLGHRVENVFAVVEEERELGVAEHRRDACSEPSGGTTFDRQRRGDGVDGRFVGRRGELAHHHRSARPRREQSVSELDEQPRLADPARADERDEAVLADRRDQLSDEHVAPDQRRHGNGEAGHRRPHLRRRAAKQLGVLRRQCR